MDWKLSLGDSRHPQPSFDALRHVVCLAGAWARRALAAPTQRPPAIDAPAPERTDGEQATQAAAAPRNMPTRNFPLRVLRVVEAGSAAASSSGRMRISGRMADVCAELDRLAEREAAFQKPALAA